MDEDVDLFLLHHQAQRLGHGGCSGVCGSHVGLILLVLTVCIHEPFIV